MKNILIFLSLTAMIASCGSSGPGDNKVNSGVAVAGSEGLGIGALVNFTGEYDILRKDTSDCSNQIRIVSECSGFKVMSSGLNPAEEFCHVNQGMVRTEDRNPPNPDRRPPNPDGNNETKTVTLEGNVLKSELRLSPRVVFTNTLTMNDNGVLVKVSNLKSRTSRCVYQKR